MLKRFKSFYQKLNSPVLSKYYLSDLLLTVPRIICGILLSKDFGADKFGMPWSPDDRNLDLFEVIYWFPQDVESYGGIFAAFPVFFAWMGAFSEAVGGMFLALGLKTRVFSFLIMCTMLVAILCQKINGPLWNMLPAMSFLWVALYNMFLGSGRFGLDNLISKKYF